MRTVRIHVDQPLKPGLEVALPPRAAGHVARVLRLRISDALVLFNGDGNDYPCELTEAGERAVHARVLAAQAVASESPLRITLAQALARGEKMDWIVQKATELGAADIVPLVTERSEVKLDGARADKRVEHWRGVAIGACEQSGRARIPEIHAPETVPAWLQTLGSSNAEMRLALLPQGELVPRALGRIESEVLLAVGPEGGFGESDLALLRDAGFRGLTLGPRVLRTETAGPAAIAALQALYGDG
ncbi:MAG: 16S rRNA (uracil(1498)-N(3))-methyltransferase [Rhodanobacteraceae bacterium]